MARPMDMMSRNEGELFLNFFPYRGIWLIVIIALLFYQIIFALVTVILFLQNRFIPALGFLLGDSLIFLITFLHLRKWHFRIELSPHVVRIYIGKQLKVSEFIGKYQYLHIVRGDYLDRLVPHNSNYVYVCFSNCAKQETPHCSLFRLFTKEETERPCLAFPFLKRDVMKLCDIIDLSTENISVIS